MPQPSCKCTLLLKLAKDSKTWGQCTELLHIDPKFSNFASFNNTVHLHEGCGMLL